MQKNLGFSTASLLLGVSVCCLKKFGSFRQKLSIWRAKLGDLLKPTKKMNKFFTYIIVIFSKLQIYSMKMYNYYHFKQLTVLWELGRT